MNIFSKEYALHLIKNMGENLTDYKLLTRIFKHSTPAFNSRVEAFINNNKIREFELFNKSKDSNTQYGNHLGLALFLLIRQDQLISIIFSKIIRIIGMSGGISQTDFISNLSKELFIVLKYNFKNKDNLDKLEEK